MTVHLYKFTLHLIVWLLAFSVVQPSQRSALRAPNGHWSPCQGEKSSIRLMLEQSPSHCQYPYLYHNAAILAELFALYENLMKQFSDFWTWIKSLENTHLDINYIPVNFLPFSVIFMPLDVNWVDWPNKVRIRTPTHFQSSFGKAGHPIAAHSRKHGSDRVRPNVWSLLNIGKVQRGWEKEFFYFSISTRMSFSNGKLV